MALYASLVMTELRGVELLVVRVDHSSLLEAAAPGGLDLSRIEVYQDQLVVPG